MVNTRSNDDGFKGEYPAPLDWGAIIRELGGTTDTGETEDGSTLKPMSEKLTARERYEADKARLAAQREANDAKYAAQREAQKAARAKIAADYHAKTAEADERLHDDIGKSKAELKQTWAEYASDRRARKEAKQAKKDSKRT